MAASIECSCQRGGRMSPAATGAGVALLPDLERSLSAPRTTGAVATGMTKRS